MKKTFLLLLLLFIGALSGCNEETPQKEILFNIEEGTVFTINVGEEFDYSTITATNQDGTDISDLIVIIGEYDVNSPNTYPLTVEVTDSDQTKKSVGIVLEVLGLSCEVDPNQDKCFISVTGISFQNQSVDINSLYIDEFIRLHWDISPLDASNLEIEIFTSDEEIATVSEYGYVFGHKEGSVTITIRTKDGDYELIKQLDVLAKSCEVDPLQEKCAAEILGDTSRLVSLGNPNTSGTDYNTIYFNNRIYYEIYVRTFADSDNNNIGDFQGIIDNLPYLKAMGVGGIWLMPITDSRSDHGYEVDDYYSVDSEYGTMDDFKALIAAADALDIDIIMDLVVNHMGAFNTYFQDVLRNGVTSDYYNWFSWLTEGDPRIDIKNSWGSQMWYNPTNRNWLRNGSFQVHSSLANQYYCAYFSDWMPDLNLQNPEVITYINDVARFWIEDIGVKGFRMDATSHFFGFNEYSNVEDRTHENLQFLTNFHNYVTSVDPEAYVVAEAWEHYTEYAEYAASNISMFNFQASYDIKSAAAGYLGEDIGLALNRVYIELANNNPDFLDAVFFNNHDTERFAYNEENPDRLRLAAEILLTLPGNPYIYYGDEVGMRGQRSNMIWGDYYDEMTVNFVDREIDDVSTQLLSSESLLNHYIELGQVRTQSLALQFGDFTPYKNNQVEGYYRSFENGLDVETIIVLFNFSPVYHKAIPSEFTSYEILYSSYEGDYGGISPLGMVILRLPNE